MTVALKNYGMRTLVANWFEERVNLDAYHEKRGTPVPIADLSVDVHVPASSQNPGMVFDVPCDMITTYGDATAPERLEEQSGNQRRLAKSNARKRLSGAASLSATVVPGSTITPTLLSRQFYDPLKQRHSTTYNKHYGRPEFEAIRGNSQRTESSKPRITALTDTWDPSWKV
jgi:hypothetical protein